MAVLHGILVAVALLLSAARADANGESDAAGFPSWEERVLVALFNRARADPAAELADCPAASCSERGCYTPTPPLVYDVALGRSARFHSAEMKAQGYFAHDSACTLVADIGARYPDSCAGTASCACVGGSKACAPACTSWSGRISLFGGHASGEIIASPSEPRSAYSLWLNEPYSGGQCGFHSQNGHRYLILAGGPLVGAGVAPSGPAVGDFGSGGNGIPKIPSGAHYPRQAASVEVWASWYDGAGPASALVNVDGTCAPLTLDRGAREHGSFHATVSGVGSGCHRYFFVFRDAGGAVVTYPDTGSLGIGDTTCADWSPERPATGAGCDCAPRCDGRVCGDDGCGGACGTCPAGTSCHAGRCQGSGCSATAAPPTDVGAALLVLALAGLTARRSRRSR